MPQVNVIINGKTYRMACDEGQEEHLLGLARQLDSIIDDLRRAFGEIGDQRLTVMAAITMADSLFEARRRSAEMEDELRALKAREAAVQEASEAEAAATLDAVAQRLSAAAARLNGRDQPQTGGEALGFSARR